MTLSHSDLETLAAEHGDSFFVLNGQTFANNFKALRKAFSDPYGDVRIGYSYKTNYTPRLCKIAHDLGGFAEVVSEMEYAHAKRLGVPGERIIFNGPVKAPWAFREAALSGATLNLDSLRDIGMLSDVAEAEPSSRIEVVIRVNFAIGEDISRFGFDADGSELKTALAKIGSLENVHLKGLHCHFPDRELDTFRTRAEGIVELARTIFTEGPPEVLNIGGGYFSNMPDSMRARFTSAPATFDDYGMTVADVMNRAFAGVRKPVLFLEPGTALVADTQVFYTRVLSIKNIRGKHFATVAGSSFDISPTARSRSLPVIPVMAEARGDGRPHDVVGFTCIEKDILSEDLVADLRPGDFLCFGNVGSYSVVMRPPFILPANPILFDAGDGKLQVIRRRQTNEDVFREFSE